MEMQMEKEDRHMSRVMRTSIGTVRKGILGQDKVPEAKVPETAQEWRNRTPNATIFSFAGLLVFLQY
jgi:hypothetical protein